MSANFSSVLACKFTLTEQQLKLQLMFGNSLFMIFNILLKNKSLKYSSLISESCNNIGLSVASLQVIFSWIYCPDEMKQVPDIFISAQLVLIPHHCYSPNGKSTPEYIILKCISSIWEAEKSYS